jgi:nucleoside recognition membrane protein YjiH
MFRSIDRSKTLSRSLEGMSASLAKRRGLIPVIGVILIIISFAVHLVSLAFPIPLLEIIWSITHHLGLILALIGLLLIEPLGR